MDSIISFLHSGFTTIAPFIVLLGFLIFVHEMGHFLVAKACGVRVEVFSLGFGKKILKFKRGDTVYCLSLIPLGGYVKMYGDEIGGDVPVDQRKYAFTHKKLWQRFAVVVAGPLMNFFFAILIFALVSKVGEDMRKPTLGDVAAGTPAYDAGFRSGDDVLKINGDAVPNWDFFQDKLTQNADHKVRVQIRRAQSEQVAELEATPQLHPNPNPLSLDDMIGEVDGLSNQSRAAVIGVLAKSQAEALGFKTGDLITAVNGKPVNFYRELENLLVSLQGQSVVFDIERFDEKSIATDKPAKKMKMTVKLPALASLQSIGIDSGEFYLAKVMDKSPAGDAGLHEGDRIVSVADKTVNRWEDVLNNVKSYSGEGKVKIQALRGDQTMSFEIVPQMTSHMTQGGAEEKRYTIGIIPWIQTAAPSTFLSYTQGPGEALERGYKRTKEVTLMTVMSFLRLIENRISPKNVGGVIAIGQAASETFKSGLGHFLQLMGIVSVNLFVLNLLPIPVLDGGHLLFYVIEGLRGGNPLSMRKMEIAQQVGLVLLMSLMALSLFNDFSRVFGLW